METRNYTEVDIFKRGKITKENIWHLNRMIKDLLNESDIYKKCAINEDGTIICTEVKSFFDRKKKSSSVASLIRHVLIDAVADNKMKSNNGQENQKTIVYNRLCEEILPELTKGDVNKAIALLYKTYIDPNSPKLFVIINGKGYLIEGRTLATVNCEDTIQDLANKIATNAQLQVVDTNELVNDYEQIIRPYYK
jgi:hypothetical protein